MAETGKDIIKAKELLLKGELVAIPTETVYGLAANAFIGKAVSKIFEVKKRPSFDPLILHSYDLEKIKDYVSDIPDKAYTLADSFWPGPLTIIFPKKEVIPDIVTSGLPNVAVRIPNHPLTLELLNELSFPLAAPSANPFGYISPTNPSHVEAQLGDKISYILDGGACQVGIESTIIGFEGNNPVIFRLGGINIEEIEKKIGKLKIMPHSTSQPQSPGMLKSHYAPKKKVIIGKIEALLLQNPPFDIGLLTFTDIYPQVPKEKQVILSASGDLNEAATNFFAGLRYLDNLPIKIIFAELLPEYGLGRAINDRLRRAAAL